MMSWYLAYSAHAQFARVSIYTHVRTYGTYAYVRERSAAAAKREREKAMEKNGKMSISEIPNATQHMDALFDVVRSYRKPESDATSSARGGTTDIMDALFAVLQSNKQANATGERAENDKKTKSWKERALPPSFFDADCDPAPSISRMDCSTEEDTHSSARSPSTSPPQAIHTTTTAVTPVPVLLVANARRVTSTAPDCLTFYIE